VARRSRGVLAMDEDPRLRLAGRSWSGVEAPRQDRPTRDAVQAIGEALPGHPSDELCSPRLNGQNLPMLLTHGSSWPSVELFAWVLVGMFLARVWGLPLYAGIGLGLVALAAWKHVGVWLVASVRVRARLSLPMEPVLTLVKPAETQMPPEWARWLSEQDAALVALGFERVGTLFSPGPQGGNYIGLYDRPNEPAVAELWISKITRNLLLRTDMGPDRDRTTLSRFGRVGVLEDPPGSLTERLVELDARRLWAVHSALVARDGTRGEAGYREPQIVMRTDPVGYRSARALKARALSEARGLYFADVGRKVRRLTWRGAFRITWVQLPRTQRRLDRQHRARTIALLNELKIH
jgi:hypothetical protein